MGRPSTTGTASGGTFIAASAGAAAPAVTGRNNTHALSFCSAFIPPDWIAGFMLKETLVHTVQC
jgi:hypothetical protein